MRRCINGVTMKSEKTQIHPFETKLISNYQRSRVFSQQIHDYIPGGAHTYSKGDDQFPVNAPAAIVRGHGAVVWDLDGNEFIDCSMGLTSVCIGHGYEPVAQAVADAAFLGTNFQRPSSIELDAAKLFLETVDAGDMVKFAKNGSTVTTAAVKLSRAYTGRNRVAIAREHNFFSYDDWFISTTPCDFGIPGDTRGLTASFSYNDISSVESLFDKSDHDIACLIMEPVKFDPPKKNFLQDVAALCRDRGVVFIMDEMISGFKWDVRGAHNFFGVRADLVTWGKGIANGFSACALTGKAEIMELGGIRKAGSDKLFLISSTHGAETTGLAAMMATIQEFSTHAMVESNWSRGVLLKDRLQDVIDRYDLGNYLSLMGYPCLFSLVCKNAEGDVDDAYRTLMLQEMISRGILFQGLFYPTWSHQETQIKTITLAFDQACAIYRSCIDAGATDGFLVGRPVKPVFRKKI